jgi:F-type H+-transporting ATPase subunit gamma
MKDTLESLRRKIESTKDLESVVRTMKALAASSIIQYENAVGSLNFYYRTVELGLALSFRRAKEIPTQENLNKKKPETAAIIVFGSDLGLVGQFNEVLVEFTKNFIGTLSGEKYIWAVGERINSRLADMGLLSSHLFSVPTSVNNITSLVRQILTKIETTYEENEISRFYIFNNRPIVGAVYEPKIQCLMPLDEVWHRELIKIQWPTKCLPEIIDKNETTHMALIREYLFVSLFRTCAESLESENASRLAAMQRAEKNIEELLEDLNLTFHQFSQSTIDEELFDVISGSEALVKSE